MIVRRLSALVALIAASAPLVAWGTPVSPPDLAQMTKAANVIVAGRVLTSSHGPVSNWEVPVTLTVAVSRTLKGATFAAGTVLKVSYVDRPKSYIRVNEDGFGLFFLRCSSTACSQATPFHLDTVALPAGPAATTSSAGPSERLRDEYLALVSADDQILAKLSAATGNDVERAYFVRSEAMRLLSRFPLAPIADQLKLLAQSPAPAPRLAAISLLARLGDYSMLTKADAEMLYPMPATELMARHLASTVCGLSGTPALEATESASRWLRSRDVEIRRESACVLRDAATVAAGTSLARFGLEDPDRHVRYYSVGGLIAAFGGVDYPSIDLYQNDEPRYLDPWLRWRDEHREALEQGTCCPTPARAVSAVARPPMVCELRTRVGAPSTRGTCAEDTPPSVGVPRSGP